LFYAAILVFGLSVSCNFPWLFVDDFRSIDDMHRDAIERVLSIDESGEVVAEGVASHTSEGCEFLLESCRFTLTVDEVPIRVYYSADSSGESCINLEAAERGPEIKNGNRVRVFGKYFELGNISICDDPDYYIEALP
jgi:hypothetical protein